MPSRELLGGEPGAEELFQLWLDARQQASEDLLFPDAATSLAEVRRRHPDARIGAVTNGRGDPRQIPSLAPYFDFCVSGEDADVHPQRKPAPRIYERLSPPPSLGARVAGRTAGSTSATTF